MSESTEGRLTDEQIAKLAPRFEVGSRESAVWGFAWHDYAREIERLVLAQTPEGAQPPDSPKLPGFDEAAWQKGYQDGIAAVSSGQTTAETPEAADDNRASDALLSAYADGRRDGEAIRHYLVGDLVRALKFCVRYEGGECLADHPQQLANALALVAKADYLSSPGAADGIPALTLAVQRVLDHTVAQGDFGQVPTDDLKVLHAALRRVSP